MEVLELFWNTRYPDVIYCIGETGLKSSVYVLKTIEESDPLTGGGIEDLDLMFWHETVWTASAVVRGKDSFESIGHI